MVSLGVRSLDECHVDWLAEPQIRKGALYEGRRTATVLGLGDELLELVEVGL